MNKDHRKFLVTILRDLADSVEERRGIEDIKAEVTMQADSPQFLHVSPLLYMTLDQDVRMELTLRWDGRAETRRNKGRQSRARRRRLYAARRKK